MNNDVKEEIKARLAVEDVVGQYVELKRAGRTLKGRSPWGVDKTPSFMVSPEKGIWHDFSANKGGDIFTFVMEVEGISFREALEKLAAQAGVNLERYGGDDAKMARRKARAREALELATKFYQWSLGKSKKTQEYAFYKRNLNKRTIEEFRIGFAPNERSLLTSFLLKRGYTKEELSDAGLLNRFDGDMFRGRLTVPFIDTNGQVIGFTARIIDQGEPKYLNTQETILFNKSRYIFGLYQAKEMIRQNGYVVIVEGNMDVISSHQAGVKETVATSGTAMTEQHLKILSRLTNDIRLAYDGDGAGVKATERAIGMARELGIKLSVISDYHGAKDPDELIQKNPDLWREAVKKAEPAIDYLLKKYEERLDLTSADGKQEYADMAMKMIADFPAVTQKHYKQMVARRLEVEPEDLESGVKNEENEGNFVKKRLKKAKTEAPKSDALAKLENDLLAIVVYGGINCDGAGNLEVPEDETKLKELELVFGVKYAGWDVPSLEKAADELVKKIRKEKNKAEIDKLMENLDDVDEIEYKLRMEKITKLTKEME